MFYNQGKYGKLKHIKIMGGLPMDKEEVVSKNFIEKIIDQDLEEGKYTDGVEAAIMEVMKPHRTKHFPW